MDSTKLSIGGRVSALAILTLICHAGGGSFPEKLLAAETGPSKEVKSVHVAVLRDVSTSMKQDGRHQTAGEALKLAATILEGRLTVVDFSQTARALSYDLPAKRRQLVEATDRTPLGGGTSYLAALKAVPPEATAVILLSDGQPSENADEVLAFLKTRSYPIHTVAIDEGAEKLLREMAASTGGSFHRARDARSLVNAFLKILAQVASFRIVESPGPLVNLENVSGKLLCIGMNGAPTIQVQELSPPTHAGQRSQDVICLPGTDVHVVTEFLPDPRNLSVALSVENSKRPGHLIVATFDGFELGLTLLRTKSGKVLAKAKFADQELARKDKEIASRFTVIGEDGQVEQVVPGKRLGDEIVAEITTPEGPYDVRVETIDAENRRRVSSRTVTDTEDLPVVEEPSPRAEVSSKLDSALFSKRSVDLLIVAHRKKGPVVLAQSGQNFHVEGLSEIDQISLEVRRGSIDPRVFSALGSAIEARWLREDGAVQRTHLKLRGDRFSTGAVRAGLPGKVTCELTLGSSTSPVTLKAETTFLPVVLKLRDTATNQLPFMVPQGT